MDAVAAEAGVSKGGFLYHFKTKQDLLSAMVERVAARYEAAQEASAEQDPREEGRATRAYLDGSFPKGKPATSRDDKLGASLLAAFVNDPDLLDPLRKRYRRWQKRLESDGIDPVRATVVRLATDGLWLADLFGLAPPKGAARKTILAALRDLADGGDLPE